MLTKQTTATVLTYSGIVPFVLLAFLLVMGIDLHYFEARTLLLVYAAVIVSFISGIHWGIYLFKACPINLFIHSNVITLVAWVAGADIVKGSELMLILCIAYLLWIDSLLIKQGIIESWFYRLRVHASSAVIFSLAMVAAFS